MKKLFSLVLLAISFLFDSCIFAALMESKVLSMLGFEIDKTEVAVGEKVTITGTLTKAFHSKKPDETVYVIYLENYPEDYEILEGTYYETTTTEKYLCLKPVPYGSSDRYGNIKGIAKISLSFENPGEHKLLLSGFTYDQNVDSALWRETSYTITVK